MSDELLEMLERARGAIRALRIADAHANRTGDESRFDRAFEDLLRLQLPINDLITKVRGRDDGRVL